MPLRPGKETSIAGASRLDRGVFEGALTLGEHGFELGTEGVGCLTEVTPQLRRQRADVAQGKGYFALTSEVLQTPRLQPREIGSRIEGMRCPFLKLCEIDQTFAPPRVE